MLTGARAESEIKVCCATFYESDAVRILLGDVLHPGGLALTRHLGAKLALGPEDALLDVACGQGVSAVYLADQFGCRVTGLDYGAEAIAAARSSAAEQGVASLVHFRQGEAEELPFEDGEFDAAISECSFCTFPEKAAAAAEMARVLRPRGRLGLTDVTVCGPLPEQVQSLLGWVTCVAGAGTASDYVAVLEAAGFGDFIIEDHTAALVDMVADVRRRLLGLEMAVGLGKLDLGDLDLDLEEAKRFARRVDELVDDGRVGYSLIAARII